MGKIWMFFAFGLVLSCVASAEVQILEIKSISELPALIRAHHKAGDSIYVGFDWDNTLKKNEKFKPPFREGDTTKGVIKDLEKDNVPWGVVTAKEGVSAATVYGEVLRVMNGFQMPLKETLNFGAIFDNDNPKCNENTMKKVQKCRGVYALGATEAEKAPQKDLALRQIHALTNAKVMFFVDDGGQYILNIYNGLKNDPNIHVIAVYYPNPADRANEANWQENEAEINRIIGKK